MDDNLPTTAFEFELADIEGKPLPLKQFTGRPMLLVNTASLCGFSSQFHGLEGIWRRYRENGIVVLGVPSNDFGHQEPGESAQVVSLCSSKFGITFPLVAKTHVRGADAHPLFKWLGQRGGVLARPRWNFYKYIIARDGQMQDWFSCLTSPNSARFDVAISKAVAGGRA